MGVRIQTLVVLAFVVAVLAGALFAQSGAMAANIYLATRNLSPGPVLRIDGAVEDWTYVRPANNLTSFTIGPSVETAATTAARPTRLYYCNAVNEKQIFRPGEIAIYTHRTFVREVAFGPGSALYFSEASGSAADGKIFRLGPGMVPVLYYTVRLAQVGGFWAGHFAFSPAGRLFVSNGNTAPAKIWGCPLGGAAPVAVYADRGPILGFCVTGPAAFWFTNGTPKLWRGAFGGPPPVVAFVSPRQNNYCDVLVNDILFRPGPN